MPFTTDDGPSIYYETLDEPENPPLVLISRASAYEPAPTVVTLASSAMRGD